MAKLLFSQSLITNGRTIATEYKGEAVTPSDSVALPSGPCNAILVTVGGNVSVALDADSTALLTLTAGEIYPIMAARVNATSTTATGIFALYLGNQL